MALSLKHASLLGAMAVAATAVTTGHASAFTFENQGASNGGSGSASFGDPDDKVLQNFGVGGSSSGQSSSSLQYGTTTTNNGQGGATLQFGTPITTTNGQESPAQAPLR